MSIFVPDKKIFVLDIIFWSLDKIILYVQMDEA